MPDPGDARRLVEQIGGSAVFYKVGMELAYGGGLPLVSELAAAGKQVFLDLKLHDIPNTVERATAQAAKLGARFLTVHAYPQTMRAAVAGAKGSGMQILAVTVLTSYDDADLFDAVYRFGVVETVRRRAEQALEVGVDGLVASAEEAAMARQTVGAKLLLVTPGIRPTGLTVGDQKRVATPAEAIRNGADYLVVGRPVTQAPIRAPPRRRSSRKSPAPGMGEDIECVLKRTKSDGLGNAVYANPTSLDEAADDPGAVVQLGARRRLAVLIQPSVHGAPHRSTHVERTSRFARRAA